MISIAFVRNNGSLLRRPVLSAGLAPVGIAVLLGMLMSSLVACSPSGDAGAGGGGTVADSAASLGGSEALQPLDNQDMKTAIDEMLRTTDTLDRNRKAIALLNALTAENLEGAIEAYEKDLARVPPHESRLFANAWARIDPRGAVDRMLAWEYPKITFQSVEEAVYVWARSGDAAEARAYVDPSIDSAKIQGKTPGKFMVLAVIKALGVAQEYDEMTALLSSLEDDTSRDLFLTEVMIEMNRVHGLPEVRSWVNGMSWDTPNDLKIGALRRGFEWTSQLGGEDVAAWYEEIESHPRAIELLPTAVARWGVRGPDDAILWLAQRPASGVRDQVIRQTATGWLGRKPDEAEAWILSQSDADEKMRELMLIPLVNLRAAQRRYPEAIGLLEQVEKEDEREYGLIAVLVEWHRLDSAAAEKYIQDATISEAVASGVRDKLDAEIKVKRRRAPAPPASPSQDGNDK
jgi:hypothetical protein